MAYRDPYTEQNGRYQNNPQYGESVPGFNPYTNSYPHETYEQGAVGTSYDNYGGGYRDEASDEVAQPAPQQSQPKSFGVGKEPSGIDDFAVPRTTMGEKSARALRNYRYDSQGNLWTKGGRGRTIGRLCCCTILITLFLIISIVLTLALWLRPPNIIFGNVAPPSIGSTIQPTADGININLGVNISVSNPNFFSVAFSKISADITYPINNTAIGGGSTSGLVFHSNSNQTFNFPFTLSYKKEDDPNNAILVDLATKCGVIGSAPSDLTVDYKIVLGIRVLFVTISPVVANTFSFACPIDKADLESLLKEAGISVSGAL